MKLFPAFFLGLFIFSGIFFGCKKFLSVSPGSKYAYLDSLNEIQGLLDNEIMRYTPTLPELSTTSYVLSDSSFNAREGKEHNAYIWAPDIFTHASNDDDWSKLYSQIYNSNLAMSCLDRIPAGDSIALWKALMADAYFKRSYSFFHLSQVFAKAYDPQTARTDLGIPLRLKAEAIVPSTRSSVQETYDQILSDLRSARALLPRRHTGALNPTRGALPAIMALNARVFLSMNDYVNAGIYADSCLSFYDTLLDYNLLSVSALRPFTANNPEVIYQSYIHGNTGILIGHAIKDCIVNGSLFGSYNSFDLRRTAFYQVENNLPRLKGSYAGLYLPFTGLTVAEMLLIRAECAVRSGNNTDALSDINTLLRKRWQTNQYKPYTLFNVQDVLKLVLDERKKELAFRGIEWSDIRRLNKIGAGIVLSRTVNSSRYELLPNSNLYALPIPPAVIEATKMEQNPR